MKRILKSKQNLAIRRAGNESMPSATRDSLLNCSTFKGFGPYDSTTGEGELLKW